MHIGIKMKSYRAGSTGRYLTLVPGPPPLFRCGPCSCWLKSCPGARESLADSESDTRARTTLWQLPRGGKRRKDEEEGEEQPCRFASASGNCLEEEEKKRERGVPPTVIYVCPVCVYYCRTFYKAVRVGEEESGGHVL